MDEEENRRLWELTPMISEVSVKLLRRVVGIEPAERVPEEALKLADELLAKHGPDALRLLVMSLTVWSSAHIEQVAKLEGRTLEAVVDDIDLTRIAVDPDD